MILTTSCPTCRGDGHLPRFGNNNPDGRNVRCDERWCEDGEVPVWCCGCPAMAEEVVDGLEWCARCAEEQRAELVILEKEMVQ